MTMNRKDLIFRVWKLFHPIHDRQDFDYLWSNGGPVSMANRVARDLWVYNIPENEDTKEFRLLNILMNMGCGSKIRNKDKE